LLLSATVHNHQAICKTRCSVANLIIGKSERRYELQSHYPQKPTGVAAGGRWKHALTGTDRSRSGHEDCGAFESACTKIGECLIGLIERIARNLSDDTDLRRQAQEINTILPREIRHRHELALFP